MTVWFMSDPHFGHKLVAQTRGFSEAFDHDLAIYRNLLERLDKHDQLWILGDLCVSNPQAALDTLADLPGSKHLISGNHDRCHPMHRDAHNWQARYLKVFDSVQPFARRRIGGRNVLLSHFPYMADRGEPRYVQWRLRDQGEFLLHGHTHSPMQWTSLREIHVGVDAWGLAPVSLDVIGSMMSRQEVMF